MTMTTDDKLIGVFKTLKPMRIGFKLFTNKDAERAKANFAKDGKVKFGADFILPNGDPMIADLMAVAKKVASAKLPGKALYIPGPGVIPAEGSAQLPFMRGDAEADAWDKSKPDKKGSKDFMRGHTVFRANGPKQVRFFVVRDGKQAELDVTTAQDDIERIFYRGAYVWANVNFKEYKGTDARTRTEYFGVKAYLNSVCFAKDGERLGGTGFDDYSSVIGAHTAENPLDGLAAM